MQTETRQEPTTTECGPLGPSEATGYIFNDEIGQRLTVLGSAFKSLNRDIDRTWFVCFSWCGYHATTCRVATNPLAALDEAIETIRKI